MKRKSIVLLMLIITVFAGAQSLDRQIRKLAVDVTRGYMEGREDLLSSPLLMPGTGLQSGLPSPWDMPISVRLRWTALMPEK